MKSQLMQSCYLWEDMLVKIIELSVEIFATETSPKISSYNAVRIEHWYNQEEKSLSQLLGSWVLGN